MWRITKIVFWILSPLVIWSTIDVLIFHFPPRFFHLTTVHWAGSGLLAGMVFWYLFRYRLSFFGVFDHEFTHLSMGLLFFYRPHSFEVQKHSGAFHLYGNNFFVTLAPYYFPTFTVFLIALSPLLQARFYFPFLFFLGFVHGYHILHKLLSFHVNQSDLQKEGLLFSALFTLSATLLFQGLFLFYIAGSWSGALFFITQVYHTVKTGAMMSLHLVIPS